MWYPPEWLAKVHYQQLLQEAANERLLNNGRPPTKRREPLLSRLGDALIQLGLRLKRNDQFLPHA